MAQTAQRFTIKEKRQLWLESLKETNPELSHAASQSQGPLSSHFEVFVPKTSQPVMPFCPMLRQEIEKISQVQKQGGPKPKDPFNNVDKFYPTVEPLESTVLQPRSIPAELLDEVHDSKLQKAGASGATARLATTSAAGQKEEAALKLHKQSSTFLRLVNSQELAVEALKNLNLSMCNSMDALQEIQGLPPAALKHIQDLQNSLTSTTLGIHDMKVANSHMASCAVSQYSSALRDRQAAWVNSSNLSGTIQSELVKSDLALPSGSSTEPLSILGPRGIAMVQGVVNKRHEDAFRDWHTQQKKVAESKAGRGKKKFKPQTQTQTPPMNWFPPSQPTQRGRGGRGGRGRGKGRGSQPFSQGKASQKDQ